MNILIAQLAHISPSTKVLDKYLKNAFKVQKKIDLVVLGEYVANKFFKEYRTKSTLKREFEANKKYFLGLAKKYKTTIVAPVIEWDSGKIYKSILVAGNSSLTQSSRELEKSTLDGLQSYLRADFPAQPTNLAQDTRIARANNLDSANSQNLSKNQTQIAESALDSANQNNPSLRANPQDLRGNPPIEKMQKSQSGWLLRDTRKSYGLPRSHSLARNDNIKSDSANLGIYRATRLMSFPHWNERAFFDNTQKAQEPLIFSVGDFKVSAIFGWEAHFDETMTKLRKKGVDILCVPCANTFGSNARWQRLMQTRSFLNSCFIVRVNRTGEFVEDGNAWEFYGESFIALPDGSLGDMMGEKEGILISEIEKENLENIKNLWQFR